jgi:hypothetical protein
MKKLFTTLLFLTLCSCSSRRDVAGSSTSSGELGAACETSDDCDAGLACLDRDDLRRCTTDCGDYDGGACPQGSLCAQNVPQTPGYCAPICSTTRECEELHPGYDSCEPFGFEAPICGIGG